MSGAWEMAEELYNYGLNSGPDKNVCSSHINEPAIQSYIKRNGEKGTCDYCGKDRLLLPLEELMKYLMQTVAYFYSDPAEFATYISAEGGYVVSHTDAWEILQDNFKLEIELDELFNDMESWIDLGRTWADEKMMHESGHYARPSLWSHFCYLVKHKARYLFYAYKNELDFEAERALGILKEAENMINKYRLIVPLKAGTEVIRCRQHHKNELITKASQMCAPEVGYCNNPNRMSPAGISMFYCAFESETALNETLDISWRGSKYTTANFVTKDDLWIIDLSKIPDLPSSFDISKRKMYEDLIFLKDLVNDLTKPIDRDGKVHIDYVPTQIITEYFRYMGEQKIDGIIYPSSKNSGFNAMVLFYDHHSSQKNLQFNPGTIKTKNIRSYRKDILAKQTQYLSVL